MSWIIFATVFFAGLLIGSFLNVVIHRGPAMWGLVEADAGRKGGLAAPRSYCPACGAPIRAFDLIPIISFFVLGGRCRKCRSRISPRYPIVEFLGGAAALIAVVIFGVTADAALAALFFFTLIALAFIDAETGYLPDALTLPLAAAGVAANLGGRFIPLRDAAIGAAAGFVVFWALAEGYRRFRGREGLGGGDAKLLAAIGAWGGWAILAPTVFSASLLALGAVALSVLKGRKLDMAAPIRFGPALCAAGAAMFPAIRLSGGLPL